MNEEMKTSVSSTAPHREILSSPEKAFVEKGFVESVPPQPTLLQAEKPQAVKTFKFEAPLRQEITNSQRKGRESS